MQEISVKELQQHPDILLKLLVQEDNADVAMYIKKEGDTVKFSSKRYSSQVSQILKEADEELEKKKKEGYSKEQAGKDFLAVQDRISKQINND